MPGWNPSCIARFRRTDGKNLFEADWTWSEWLLGYRYWWSGHHIHIGPLCLSLYLDHY